MAPTNLLRRLSVRRNQPAKAPRCDRYRSGKWSPQLSTRDAGVLSCLKQVAQSGTPNKKGPPLAGWAFSFGAPGGDLLSRGQSALASALRRFTVLFGMGRRGSTSLWPPSKTARLETRDWKLTYPAPGSSSNLEEVFLGSDRQQQGTATFEPTRVEFEGVGFYPSLLTPYPSRLTQGYRIKPHGQLVSVSLTCCHASTPDLSTRWSSATLQVT